MIRRRSPTFLRGLVCMTDFLFAVIAGLLFLTVQVSQEAHAMRDKTKLAPETAGALASTEDRLRALETSTQELKTNVVDLAKAVADRSSELTNRPLQVLPGATAK